MVNDTRARILQAAKTLAESNDSIQGVTISLESVAQAAGLTKPGLMYHFPNKEALMLGLVDHAAQQWHQRLHDHTGSEPVELSAFERHRAYVSVATTAEVSRADYWIFSDALYHPTLAASWDRHLSPWFDICRSRRKRSRPADDGPILRRRCLDVRGHRSVPCR